MLQCIGREQESLLNTIKNDSRSNMKLDAAGKLAGIDIALGRPEQRRAEIADYFATVYGYSLEQIEAEADMLGRKESEGKPDAGLSHSAPRNDGEDPRMDCGSGPQ